MSSESRFLCLKYRQYGIIIACFQLLVSCTICFFAGTVFIASLSCNAVEFENINNIRTASSIIFALSAIVFVTSTFLLKGLIQRRHKLIVPWLVYSSLYIVFAVCLMAFMMTIAVQAIRNDDPNINRLFNCLFLIMSGTFIFSSIWKFIFHLYKSIRNDSVSVQQKVMKSFC